MKFPACPYCLRPIEYSIDNEISCIQGDLQGDHEFWCAPSAKPPNWTIYLVPQFLNIDNTQLVLWNAQGQRIVLMSFDNISPEEGAQILKRYLKLKSFS